MDVKDEWLLVGGFLVVVLVLVIIATMSGGQGWLM
jgi:hypothetical protein